MVIYSIFEYGAENFADCSAESSAESEPIYSISSNIYSYLL